jgi:uncharacterized surface protein with fasciclin (FAS1) repeats
MRKTAAGIAAASAAALAAGALAAPAANAATLGENSLAAVLLSDNNQFDTNHRDFDIVTEAALAVLTAKPASKVGVLTTGNVAVTAFVPTDAAFMTLVKDLTGKTPASEEATFKAVAGLGIPTVEKVLLYHVVPGATIDAKTALTSNRAKLTTAQGKTVEVLVYGQGGSKPSIRLSDRDYNARNARVIGVDVNAGNKQIAHVVDRVVRPMDLPPIKK